MSEKFDSSTQIPSDPVGDEPAPDIALPEVTEPGPAEKASKPGNADSSSDLPKPADQAVGVIIGCLLWVIPLAVAMFFDAGRKFLYHRWWAVGAGIILLAALFFVERFRVWFAKLAEEKRTGILVFIVLPLLLVAIGTIVLLPRPYQITVVRSVFLVAVCLFPALLYYLFIAARKISLLNDYFVNLRRLGLLPIRQAVSASGDDPRWDDDRKVRLRNYVQKFEALYVQCLRQCGKRSWIRPIRSPFWLHRPHPSGAANHYGIQVLQAISLFLPRRRRFPLYLLQFSLLLVD